MKLQDLITLATQGYKLAEIKELVELADKDGQVQNTQEEKDTEQENPKNDDSKQEEASDEPEDVEKDVVDYKKLYEAEKEKVKELQQANIRKDSSEERPDNEQVLQDIIKNFM